MEKTSKSTVSRDSDKFMLRFPEGMRDRIAEAAKANNRSMNAEIVDRLEHSVRRDANSADSHKTIDRQMSIMDQMAAAFKQLTAIVSNRETQIKSLAGVLQTTCDLAVNLNEQSRREYLAAVSKYAQAIQHSEAHEVAATYQDVLGALDAMETSGKTPNKDDKP